MSQNNPQYRVSHSYNPGNQSREDLINNFVVRTKEFNKIFSSINATSLSEPPQHYLIEGQRGAGKTTLMLRIRYELESKEGSKHILPLQLSEEQYGVFSLCKLWEHIADHIELESGFEGIVETFDTHAEEEDYEINCFEWLDDYLSLNRKRLVLFIDNFGDMLDRFNKTEHKRLRDIFHTTKNIQLIAGSVPTLQKTYNYDEPFYEFFKIIRLSGLTSNQAVSLLKRLGEQYGSAGEINRIAYEEPERIETIRLLTGGVPRTIVLLFEIFLDKNAEVFDDLEVLLDRVTPLYKHRMDDLSRQQQAIVDVLALNWDGITTGEIAKCLRTEEFSTKKVAAQLKTLEQDNIVISKLVDRKNKIYFISERFFNIWYLMRHARKRDSSRVRWLVEFLQAWYTPDQITRRVTTHLDKMRQGTLNVKGAYHLTEALAQVVSCIDMQDTLISHSKSYLEALDSTAASKLLVSDKSLLEKAIDSGNRTEFEKQLIDIKRARGLGDAESPFYTGKFFHLNGEPDQAIEYYLMAIELGESKAMNNLANLYLIEKEDIDKAIEYYLMAIELGDSNAMYNLANIYQIEKEDIDKAIEYYLMAIELGESKAMNNLASLYRIEKEDVDKAIEYYLMAIELGESKAMNNLASLYRIEKEDVDKAIEYYLMAVELGESTAMNNLASLYRFEKEDIDKAIEYYLMAIELGESKAMNNLANLYLIEKEDIDKAIEYYLMAIELGDSDAMNKLAWLYFDENIINRSDQALEFSERSLSIDSGAYLLDTKATILLWKNKFDESIEVAKQLIESGAYQDIVKGFSDYLIF